MCISKEFLSFFFFVSSHITRSLCLRTVVPTRFQKGKEKKGAQARDEVGKKNLYWWEIGENSYLVS